MSKPPVSSEPPVEKVVIVDDDEAVRDSLQWLLESDGYQVQTFSSAESFLMDFNPTHLCVLLLDVRMQGMSGLELQERLLKRHISMPIIFITGHGDVAMAVNTMKKGAADFLEKPFNEIEVRHLVRKNFEENRSRYLEGRKKNAVKERFARLTGRETQVLDRIIAGRLNKQIADDLIISIKTVEAHRSNIMDKLDVSTVADLLKLALARDA
ncbi:MAG: response regulator transcription factor [Burkholderiaceae bacterium]|jgi:two-component system response regulator TtrR